MRTGGVGRDIHLAEGRAGVKFAPLIANPPGLRPEIVPAEGDILFEPVQFVNDRAPAVSLQEWVPRR
jgi:hypothetical protein